MAFDYKGNSRDKLENLKGDKVYIVLLNWNGWKDTIECLESVLRSSYTNYQVIICDNCSTDNSIENIKEWAEGKRAAKLSYQSEIHSCTYPSIEKPISYLLYTKKHIEEQHIKKNDAQLILIQTGANLGFAGGNNIGIQYAIKQNDFQYVWVLNNDTVVHKNALKKLVAYYQQNKNIGICGSRLLSYNKPDEIQGLGGTYNKFTGKSKHILKKNEVHRLEYVVGASMLVSKKFLTEIGLMNEEYFLYYEELDWSCRCRDKYQLAVALDSIVYHKEGATIGTGSELSEFYLLLNRIRFSRKHYKFYAPIVFLMTLVTMFNPFRIRVYKRIDMFLKVIKSAF